MNGARNTALPISGGRRSEMRTKPFTNIFLHSFGCCLFVSLMFLSSLFKRITSSRLLRYISNNWRHSCRSSL